VAAQLGHAKPSTTLQFYARWIPSGTDRAFIDRLERARTAAPAPALGIPAPEGRGRE